MAHGRSAVDDNGRGGVDLPIDYRESDAYRADKDLGDRVIGDSEDVLGSSEDRATDGLRAILGNPLQQVRSVDHPRVGRIVRREQRVGRNVIKVHQRNDKLILYQLRDETDTPIDITDADILFIVSKYPNHRDILFTKQVVKTNPLVGEIELELSAGDTDLPAGLYIYELLLVDVDGHRYTADQGWLNIITSIGEVI